MSYWNEKSSKAVEISAVDCKAVTAYRAWQEALGLPASTLIATYKYQISVCVEKASAEDRK